ncbi:MAG: enoyl-CoA hydratase/isomerase family protein [Sphingomonadaceae bacterium]
MAGRIDHFLVESQALSALAAPLSAPLCVIDLDRAGDVPDDILLPPCPVVGIGNPEHRLAAELDTVMTPPFPLDAIIAGVEANPRAAAIIVQLLRQMPAMSIDAGLWAESLAYAVLQGSDEYRAWLGGRGPISGGAGEGAVLTGRIDETLTITLDRPDAGNAIDRAMRDGLHDAFALAALDSTIRQVRLRANGKAFSLGAELDEFGTTLDPATAHDIRMRSLPARQVARCADRLEVHIDGACVGAGLEIAAFARRVTATSRAWFQLPELAMGILPGAGGCVSLTRRIGRQKAALMILSGKRLSAREALSLGLIDAIVDVPS